MARTIVVDRDTQKVNRSDGEPHHSHKDLESGLATLHDAFPDVQAFAVFALKDDGRVDLCASKHVQPFINAPKFVDARSDLSKAHETAVHSAFVFDDASVTDRDTDVTIAGDEVSNVDTASVPMTKSETRRRHQASSTKLGRPRESPHPHFEQPATMETPDDASADAIDDEPIPRTTRARAFMINEEEKVKAFLYDRIGRIHQLSDKKIAKAWIKGICPKKQAIFPYQNKQREKEFGQPPVVPAWWPPLELCRFVEPDHITRDHRNNLLVHLLRLRPEADQLRVWNNDKSEPHPTHKNVGWTAFLRELAPIDSLDEITPTAENKVKTRRDMLADVYRIAEMEEDFQRFDMVQQVQDMSVEKPSSNKRSRRAASEATSAGDASYVLSRSSSPSPSSRAPSKRARRGSTRLAGQMSTFAITEEDEVMTEADESQSRMQHGVVPMETTVRQPLVPAAQRRRIDQKPTVSDVKRQRRSHPTTEQWRTARREQHQAAMQQQWQASHSLTTSFNSCTSGPAQQLDPYEAHMGGQSMFPGNHNYAFPQAQYSNLPQLQPQPHAQQPQQVYQTARIPEPHFDTVPNTPTFSPPAAMYPHNMTQPSAYDMAAVANSMPVSQPMTMLPSQQEMLVPAGYIDHDIAHHGGQAQYHPQAYGLQHAEPHQHVGQHGLLPAYARRDPQMQYGGLPVSYAELEAGNGFQHLPHGFAGHPT